MPLNHRVDFREGVASVVCSFAAGGAALPVIASSAPQWLEIASWVSQVALVFITLLAVFAALHQVNAFKLFELLKFIQEENFRDARRRVIVEIGARRDEQWWEDHSLEAAASTCCAHYDIVGNMLIFSGSKRLKVHFIKHWSDSIVRTYEILGGFVERRRAAGGNSYASYYWLYQSALKYKNSVGRAWPSAPENTSARN